MSNLVKAEFFKLRKSLAFKVLLAMYFVFEILYTINEIGNSVLYPAYNPTFTGAEWFCQVPGANGTGYFAIALFLFAAFYVAGEFHGRTLYRGLLCGLLRRDVFGAKVIVFTVGAVLLLLVHIVTGTTLWTIHSGFGMDSSDGVALFFTKAIASLLLQLLILVSHALLFAVMTKNKIGAFALGYGVLDVLGLPFWRTSVRSDLVVFTYIDYLQASWESSMWALLVCAAEVILMLLAAGYLFARCDLK